MRATDWQSAAENLAARVAFGNAADALLEAAERGGNAPVACACSGGADSLCALLLLWAKFPRLRERLLVLHYDHAAREDSAADAEFVRRVAAALGAAFVCGRRERDGEKISEAALRVARLRFFADAMRERRAKILVQGHQRDDVAETLLMRLTRGAGAEGLAAPRPVSRRADGRIFLRPLLDVPKEKIIAALRDGGVPWREDPTNAGTDFFRNRVRNAVLPALKAAAPFENFARSRALLEEAADFIDAEAEKILRGNASPAAASALAGKSPALVRCALRKILAAQKISLRAKTFEALLRSVAEKTPFALALSARKISWDGAALKIIPFVSTEKTPPPPAEFETEEIVVSEALFARIRAGTFPPDETVFLAGTPKIFARELRRGDRYRPLGAPGEKPVRRIFIDKKIPRERRAALPVFDDGTGIAWIPGLPPAERFRIRAAGTKALRLTYRRKALPL